MKSVLGEQHINITGAVILKTSMEQGVINDLPTMEMMTTIKLK